ncbi:uncharacterized protein LOC119648480 [Hermetia illucens]|uniref:uncharacterized protein LOC119648480 n=1 Tax=Hermetia illucens TaxID=343691 RepID=UPI0018CC1F12|nr:uncharacterized protein LOC119648480 [Hermetia illucens]
MRTLHQLSNDERMHHPKACRAIKEDFYVDDVLTGGDTIKEAQTLQQDLIKVLQKGGFKLRKWAANHDSLLESIPVSDREANPPLSIDKEDHIKTLGLRWHPARDCFFFKVTLEEITGTVLTKRQLLSEVAKLFDPMGWLQPCIVVGKIMMQQLWLQHRTWDEPITEELDAKWRNFRSQLPVLQEITIPRWLHCSDTVTIQVHGFCDASEAAYAAVIYVRIEERDGSTTVQLITSKSKVAPLKVQSIPRLELCSAALLCDLMSTTLEAHGWKDVIPYYWTDSMIVLQWLQSPAAKWKVFIANRVSHIHSSSDSKQWRHINSKANPADVASRGIFHNFLKNHVQWWNGPDWLKEHQDKWPKSRFICNKAVTNLEVRQKAVCFTTIKAEEKENLTQRFSSFTKLVRVIAYCRRWRSNSHNPFLKSDELRQAETALIRVIQREAFADDISLLNTNKPLAKTSSLIRLTPFLDSDQILRVGGRIQQSAANFDTKHPILLPRGHMANLVIKHYHHLMLHGPAQLVHSTIRTKYWIIDGLTAVKQFGRKCTHCFRMNAKPSQQLMGILPQERVRPGKPFARTGIDYAGPITIKWSNGRGTKTTKAYIVVFVCLSTKAVHLELASDLTAKTRIVAIRRFIARRGMCHTLISDNGTNFVGADKLLRETARKMIEEAQGKLAVNNIDWKFIPPGSPHFGGIWEAAVKSMKRHLIKTIGAHLLNVEEMFTLLAQIEACMNSRPLTPLSIDPHDLTALTPGHSLTGEHLFELPDGNTEDNVTKKWQLVQRLKQQFWHRWSLEYLTQLQQRAKWFSENRKINVDDLVLIKCENQPSGRWPLGRIVAVHPGNDGLTRVVTLKTENNIIKRPISKICPLPNNGERTVEPTIADIGIHPNRQKRKQESRSGGKTSKMQNASTLNQGYMSSIWVRSD